MSPSETSAAYDSIAGHWASDAFNAENGIAQHRRALQFVGPPDDKSRRNALDVGCGSSGRLIELLSTSGFQAEGLDISSEMLNLARAKHPQVTFHQADICEWIFPRRYDFISAWDSVWHVPLEQQPQVIAKLCRGLAPRGVLIFTAGGTDAPGEVTNDCRGAPLYHATLGIPRLLRLIDEVGCICRHLEYDQWPEMHVYLIVQQAE